MGTSWRRRARTTPVNRFRCAATWSSTPGARILFDTGISPFDEETRERYLPRVNPVAEVLAGIGLALADIDLIATRAGRVLLAGQAFTTASDFSFAAFSHRLDAAGLDSIGTFPPWMARVAALKPQRGYFAHDLLTYEPDPADIGHPQRM